MDTSDTSEYLNTSEILENLEIQLEQATECIQRPLDTAETVNTPDTSEILEILEVLGIQLGQEVLTRHQQEITEYIQTNFI